MRKSRIFALLCAILVSITISACKSSDSKANNSRNPVPASSNSSFSSYYYQVPTQNLHLMSELMVPDKIIYYHNGNQTVFKKDDEKFDKVIEANKERERGELGMASGMFEFEEISNTGLTLVYDYSQSGYAPLFFQLDKNDYNQYFVAQYTSPQDLFATPYGPLAPPDQLLALLNS